MVIILIMVGNRNQSITVILQSYRVTVQSIYFRLVGDAIHAIHVCLQNTGHRQKLNYCSIHNFLARTCNMTSENVFVCMVFVQVSYVHVYLIVYIRVRNCYKQN